MMDKSVRLKCQSRCPVCYRKQAKAIIIIILMMMMDVFQV